MKRLAFIAAFVLVAGIAAFAAAAPTLLPTGHSIEPPTGPVGRVGNLPLGLALSRDGTRLIVVEGGFTPPGLRILDALTLAQRIFIPLTGAFGVPLVDNSGDGVWVAGANADAAFHLDLRTNAVDARWAVPKGCWPTALAHVGERLAASCDRLHAIVLVGADGQATTVAVGSHPSAIIADPARPILYASAWGEHSVDVIALAGGAPRLVRRIGVGTHPEALALAPDGKHLYVANTDDDSISIVDLRATDQLPRIFRVPFKRSGLIGNSLNALAVSPDGKRLYASAGAANAVYAFAIDKSAGLKRLGAIPAGWYPTAILIAPAGGRIYVANSKGERSLANPRFDTYAFDRFQAEEDRLRTADPAYPGPSTADVPERRGYMGQELRGSVRAINLPSGGALRAGDARVRWLAGDSPLRDNPVVRGDGPIRHVIYIIKENRTYDQVFGDLPGADGDPDLVLFGEQITPNQHAIARRFGIFDRTFADAQVSADGHNWSTAAFANDYVEKTWQPNYAHRRTIYDFEDPVSPAHPPGGYIWDAAVNAHRSLRNYGEFIYIDNPQGWASSTLSKVLVDNTDRRFHGYDTKISDLVREAEWEREFREYERNGNLPALEIVRLGNDHTYGTREGALTPEAFVAQNDAALGKLVDVVSHSRFWPSTAIFAIEDDSQNGPDHVDNQRTMFWIASPYARGGVCHAMYTTSGVLRTIEIMLGIPPMTAYDAQAAPLYDAFAGRADARIFEAMPPKIDITARNAKTAYRAADSARLDFEQADSVDEATFNDILWHAVKGARATAPPYGNFRR